MYISPLKAHGSNYRYDYTIFNSEDGTNKREVDQETRAQRNNHERTLDIVQNPYYGVDDNEVTFNAIKVTENPYYET